MIFDIFYQEAADDFIPSKRFICNKFFNSSSKKCNKFFTKLNNMEDGEYICPYGYTCFKKFNMIFTGLITNKSNIKKIEKRNKYFKISENHSVMPIEMLDSKIDEHFDYKECYESVRPIIHDVGNAIHYLLQIKDNINQKIYDISNLNIYYNNVKSHIESIRTFSRYKNLFKYNENYKKITENLLEQQKQLSDDVKFFNDKVESLLHQYSFNNMDDKYTRSYFEGFSLLETLIRYNEKIQDVNLISSKVVPLKPHKMFKKLARLLGYKAYNNRVKIEFDIKKEDIYIKNTPDLFIMFFTLLDNAIKYSKRYTDVIIEFDVDENKNYITIYNEYTGCFNQEDIDKIGNKGFQGSNHKDGKGFGLYLVDQIKKSSNTIIDYSVDNNHWCVNMVLNDML
jgi:hypothetical protein